MRRLSPFSAIPDLIMAPSPCHRSNEAALAAHARPGQQPGIHRHIVTEFGARFKHGARPLLPARLDQAGQPGKLEKVALRLAAAGLLIALSCAAPRV